MFRLLTTCKSRSVLSHSLLPLQLKKETISGESEIRWTAGCIANCSGQSPCKVNAQPPCHLECCNATKTSCLWLNGTLNVPSFATRGPYLHTELIVGLLCLITVTFILWVIEYELAQPLCGSIGNQSFVWPPVPPEIKLSYAEVNTT